MTDDLGLKDRVRTFWQAGSCGEVYALGSDRADQLRAHGRMRYELEPYILSFADFPSGEGKDILEVGVGMGADHLEWAKSNPRSLAGVDMTHRATQWTAQRLALAGQPSRVAVADAEHLPFPPNSFDIVYSWGVLHHTPDTAGAIQEVRRVLRPGGEARIMIYHSRSIVGYLLWLRYGLLAGHPRRPLKDIYASHLESPGTQAFSIEEGRALVAEFSHYEVGSRLSFGDLLEGEVGQRHRGALLSMARRLYPRKLVTRLLPGHGLLLLIRAVK